MAENTTSVDYVNSLLSNDKSYASLFSVNHDGLFGFLGPSHKRGPSTVLGCVNLLSTWAKMCF